MATSPYAFVPLVTNLACLRVTNETLSALLGVTTILASDDGLLVHGKSLSDVPSTQSWWRSQLSFTSNVKPFLVKPFAVQTSILFRIGRPLRGMK